jgi:8-oxo-dGTP pyrophosphatase MutT (NUDIX family)
MDDIDPRLAKLKQVLAKHPVLPVEREPDSREAAVALLLRPRDTFELLLIKRAEHESDPWSGHMALPGGRRDAGDSDLYATAVRETEEEIGVQLGRVGQRIGLLDEVAPRTPRLPPFIITPFVLGVPHDTHAEPDAKEVEAALWIPITALQQPEAVSELVLELEGGKHSFPSLRYGEHVIWGLTHRILTQFLERAAEAGL